MTILTYERIQYIQSCWINEKFLDKSIIKDWTEFVHKALTTGALMHLISMNGC
ncbi:hypothetical protein CPT_Muldoon_021 [Serratia phage Muldoon]|uniref:Uncharacterized protein n=1 Tax=Serratia phage Muldoon TaxID=2601678 RepID=A0A5P8PH03_9CAUD|nr:hypothetical protein HYP94_gp021 [Serratia phage Muldoon]QFR55978.1 hypothetical protein CPT_Muldoon_021 [Serratia phage Muldoon]